LRGNGARVCRFPRQTIIADVTARLKAWGLGVLTAIDVQATLKSRIGVHMPKYGILDPCNPRFAHEALKIEHQPEAVTKIGS
jgi:uncharacterized protein (DUF302 family)